MQTSYYFTNCPSIMYRKSERCSVGKHSKMRLTGLAAANAIGDNFPMLVIDTSPNFIKISC